MKEVAIGRTGLRASELGFGCAPILGRVGASKALRALDAAYDRGITYFDVARSYGYGEAEELVGRFLQGKRSKVVLATKFGIEAGKPSHLRRALKTLLRPLVSGIPPVRSALRRRLAREFTGGHFSVAQMRASLEESLRALRTEQIDVFLLHGCSSETLGQTDLLDELDRLGAAGKIRCFGLATDWRVIAKSQKVQPRRFSVWQCGLSLLQLEASTLLASASEQSASAIAHSPFGGGKAAVCAIQSGLAELAHRPETSPQLREKLDKVPNAFADAALNSVLRDTGVAVALATMFEERHVEQNIRACEESAFSKEDLVEIRRYFMETSSQRLRGE